MLTHLIVFHFSKWDKLGFVWVCLVGQTTWQPGKRPYPLSDADWNRIRNTTEILNSLSPSVIILHAVFSAFPLQAQARPARPLVSSFPPPKTESVVHRHPSPTAAPSSPSAQSSSAASPLPSEPPLCPCPQIEPSTLPASFRLLSETTPSSQTTSSPAPLSSAS